MTAPDVFPEASVMDVWFIILTLLLTLSTWGALLLFARVLKRP